MDVKTVNEIIGCLNELCELQNMEGKDFAEQTVIHCKKSRLERLISKLENLKIN